MSAEDTRPKGVAEEAAEEPAQRPVDESAIPGDRLTSPVSKRPSLQVRMTNALAMLLMGALGLGLLVWYFSHAIEVRQRAKDDAESSTAQRAKGDFAVKPLGRVDPPKSVLDSLLGDPPEEPPPEDIPPAWLAPATDELPAGAGSGPNRTRRSEVAVRPNPPAKSPEDLAGERRLSGSAFLASRNSSSENTDSSGAETGRNTQLLQSATVPVVRVQALPTQRLLLPKGSFLDCTLETAIDSTLPGMTTCILATDAFSADGSVVLLERGTRLVGETGGGARQGSARLFVVWNEARTPTGLVVPLASPGADPLGRSGLPGRVNRHFWERFGAALLLSVVDGAIESAVASQRGDAGTVVVNPSATSDIATEVLRSSVAIPPTITKAQGDRIQVLVARDIDFRSVYELAVSPK